MKKLRRLVRHVIGRAAVAGAFAVGAFIVLYLVFGWVFGTGWIIGGIIAFGLASAAGSGLFTILIKYDRREDPHGFEQQAEKQFLDEHNRKSDGEQL